MNISKAQYKMSMSEEELIEAIEFYTKHKYNQDVKITYLKHNVGYETDISGYDIPYQKGVEFTCD